MPVFKTGAFNRSAISPHRVYHAGAGLEPLPSPGHEPGELTRALPRAHQALRSPHTLLPSVLPSTTFDHPSSSFTRLDPRVDSQIQPCIDPRVEPRVDYVTSPWTLSWASSSACLCFTAPLYGRRDSNSHRIYPLEPKPSVSTIPPRPRLTALTHPHPRETTDIPASHRPGTHPANSLTHRSFDLFREERERWDSNPRPSTRQADALTRLSYSPSILTASPSIPHNPTESFL